MRDSRSFLLLVAATVLAVVAIVEYTGRERATEFQFRELKSPAGFRRLVLDGGDPSQSAFLDPLVGLDAADRSGDALPPLDVCAGLFGRADDPAVGPADAAVTIVEFFDYQCPYCRVVAKFLPDLVAENGSVRVVYKEWPIFGQPSELAARAALAAHRQGKYGDFHRALMASRMLPTEASILGTADAVGADADRLSADMGSASIAASIKENARLAGVLGFKGTPSFVVGRTLVEGALGKDQLRRLVAVESAGEALPCA